MISNVLLGLLAAVTGVTALFVEIATFLRHGKSERVRRPGRLILF